MEYKQLNPNTDHSINNDCLARSIMQAINVPLDRAAELLQIHGYGLGNHGGGHNFKLTKKILVDYGVFLEWYQSSKKSVTVSDIIKAIGDGIDRCIFVGSSHACFVSDKTVYDTWDSRNMEVVGFFTLKEN